MVSHRFYLKNAAFGQLLQAHQWYDRFLSLNYHWFFGVDIVIEGLENLPKDKSVIIAMNQPAYYTAWPFQFALRQEKHHRRVISFVKAKDFENPMLKPIWKASGGIMVPSKSQLILSEIGKQFGRRADPDEYTAVKQAIEQDLAHQVHRTYEQMLRRWQLQTTDVLSSQQCHIIAFPQSSPSKRLLPCQPDLIQEAIKQNVPIVPVGAQGADLVYPGKLPWARKGRVHYRIGKPLVFAGANKSLMLTRAINELLEAPYQLKASTHFKT
ncbi:MAG: lysophospholipid acyltransferase family protein [Myxococcota bacterium]